VSGIVRAQVVNGVFGAGVALDAYNVAMRFPTVLRDLFAEGALSAAFTKSLVEARAADRAAALAALAPLAPLAALATEGTGTDTGTEAEYDEGKAGPCERALTGMVTAVFGMITLSLAVACVFVAEPLIASVTAADFGAAGGTDLARDCFRILAFYLPVAMLSAVAMALLGVRGLTFRATIASLFFNVGSVAGALVGAPIAVWAGSHPILGLAVGTLIGGVLQFLYQLAPLWRAGAARLPRLRDVLWRGEGPGGTRVFQRHPLIDISLLMLPRMLGQGALSIALFVNTHFATAAGPGAVTYITNAQNIILVPVGLFGVASALASLPLLTQAAAARDEAGFSSLLRESMRGTLWLSSVSVVALALLSVPLAKGLLEHGKVTPADSLANGLAITAYCLSILFNGLSKVTVQGYYALGDTRQIVTNALCYLAVNATLSALLAPRLGILGLGISNCVAAGVDLVINLVFLPRVARRRGLAGYRLAGPGPGVAGPGAVDPNLAVARGGGRPWGFPMEIGLHVTVGIGAVAASLFLLRPWFIELTRSGAAWFSPWSALLVAGTGAAVIGMVWGGCVWVWGPPQLRDLFRRLAGRFGRR
jgi:putative peptidoglycan lipid II flippase